LGVWVSWAWRGVSAIKPHQSQRPARAPSPASSTSSDVWAIRLACQALVRLGIRSSVRAERAPTRYCSASRPIAYGPRSLTSEPRAGNSRRSQDRPVVPRSLSLFRRPPHKAKKMPGPRWCAVRGFPRMTGLPNKRLLLPGRERLRRRTVCLMELDCGGCGTPRSRSAAR
jgi:hypothetical protein